MAEVRAPIDFESLSGAARDSLFEHISTLLKERSSILCVGISSLSIARMLAKKGDKKVTLLVDYSDYQERDAIPELELMLESLEKADITGRFERNRFDAVLLSDPPQKKGLLSSKLGEIAAYFNGALVLSLPQLAEKDKVLIRRHENEIERLKQLLRVRDETIAWYAKRLREHLANQYNLENTHRQRVEHDSRALAESSRLAGELAAKERAYEALREDRDRIKAHLDHSMRYSIEHLPALLRYPIKSLVALFRYGPLEPIRAIKKKSF